MKRDDSKLHGDNHSSIVLTDRLTGNVKVTISDVGNFDVLPDSFGNILVCAAGPEACEQFEKENGLVWKHPSIRTYIIADILTSFSLLGVPVTTELNAICNLIATSAKCDVYVTGGDNNTRIPFVKAKTEDDIFFYALTALVVQQGKLYDESVGHDSALDFVKDDTWFERINKLF